MGTPINFLLIPPLFPKFLKGIEEQKCFVMGPREIQLNSLNAEPVVPMASFCRRHTYFFTLTPKYIVLSVHAELCCHKKIRFYQILSPSGGKKLDMLSKFNV